MVAWLPNNMFVVAVWPAEMYYVQSPKTGIIVVVPPFQWGFGNQAWLPHHHYVCGGLAPKSLLFLWVPMHIGWLHNGVWFALICSIAAQIESSCSELLVAATASKALPRSRAPEVSLEDLVQSIEVGFGAHRLMQISKGSDSLVSGWEISAGATILRMPCRK